MYHPIFTEAWIKETWLWSIILFFYALNKNIIVCQMFRVYVHIVSRHVYTDAFTFSFVMFWNIWKFYSLEQIILPVCSPSTSSFSFQSLLYFVLVMPSSLFYRSNGGYFLCLNHIFHIPWSCWLNIIFLHYCSIKFINSDYLSLFLIKIWMHKIYFNIFK